MKWFKGNMPDITAAQAVGALTWVVAQAVAWGWVNNAQGQKFIATASTVITGLWMVGDAFIRSARNKRAAQEAVAAKK